MTDVAPAAADAAVAPENQGAPIEKGPDTPNPAEKTVVEKRSLDDVLNDAEAKVAEAQTKADEAKKAEESENKGDKEKPEAKDAKPDKVAKEADEAKAKEKTEDKEARARGEDGKFVSSKPQDEGKEAAQPESQRSAHHEPPHRFDDAAKADWEKTPDSVRGATNRALREAENGIQKYRESAEAFESVREFHDMAKRNNTDLRGVLEQISAIEDAFAKDPVEGFQRVADRMGVSLQALAAHVMGQEPDKNRVQNEAQMSQLRNENAQLKQQLQSVQREQQQSQYNNAVSQVQTFKEQHPRFDELAREISIEIKLLKQADSSLSQTDLLDMAYRRADRNNPSPAGSEPLTPAPANDAAHTRTPNEAGTKSVSGAPASGSDPAVPPRQKSKSVDESLDRAFARFG